MRDIVVLRIAAAAVTCVSWSASAADTGASGQSEWFGSVSGFQAKTNGENSFIAGNLVPAAPKNGDGWAIHGGYRFRNAWDVAIGLSSVDLETGTGSTLPGPIVHTVDGQYRSLDVELGYTLRFGDAHAIRPFAGVRHAKWTTNEGFPSTGGGSPGSAIIETSGWGPRVGVDARFGIAPIKGLSLIAQASYSRISGDLDERGSFTGFAPPNVSIDRSMKNHGAMVGLSYAVSGRFDIAAGYRWEKWTGVTFLNWAGPAGGPGSGSLDRRLEGPFVRLSYGM